MLKLFTLLLLVVTMIDGGTLCSIFAFWIVNWFIYPRHDKCGYICIFFCFFFSRKCLLCGFCRSQLILDSWGFIFLLHRFEPDMLAFSGCYYGGGEKERAELGAIRKRWKTLHVRLPQYFILDIVQFHSI